MVMFSVVIMEKLLDLFCDFMIKRWKTEACDYKIEVLWDKDETGHFNTFILSRSVIYLDKSDKKQK